jgi:ribonuclease VapC
MVLDSSVPVAILLGEPEAALFAAAIEAASPRLLSAASLLEASIVIETRKGEAAARELDFNRTDIPRVVPG